MDPWFGTAKKGATGITIPVILLSTTDSQGLTGVAAGSVTAYYSRDGGTAVAITVTGNWAEISAANMPGTYDLTLPNGMWASGANYVVLNLRATGAYHFNEKFTLADDEHDRAIENESVAYVVRTRPVREALQRLRNRESISGSIFTVYELNDTSASWAGTITADSEGFITDLDPD